MAANVLLVFNRNPYDGTDVTWNGLRLADQLLNAGLEVNVFLMNYLDEEGFENIQARLIENRQILWVSGRSCTKNNYKSEQTKVRAYEA